MWFWLPYLPYFILPTINFYFPLNFPCYPSSAPIFLFNNYVYQLFIRKYLFHSQNLKFSLLILINCLFISHHIFKCYLQITGCTTKNIIYNQQHFLKKLLKSLPTYSNFSGVIETTYFFYSALSIMSSVINEIKISKGKNPNLVTIVIRWKKMFNSNGRLKRNQHFCRVKNRLIHNRFLIVGDSLRYNLCLQCLICIRLI